MHRGEQIGHRPDGALPARQAAGDAFVRRQLRGQRDQRQVVCIRHAQRFEPPQQQAQPQLGGLVPARAVRPRGQLDGPDLRVQPLGGLAERRYQRSHPHREQPVADGQEGREDVIGAAVRGEVRDVGAGRFARPQLIPDQLEGPRGHVGMPNDVVGRADQLPVRIVAEPDERGVGQLDDAAGVGHREEELPDPHLVFVPRRDDLVTHRLGPLRPPVASPAITTSSDAATCGLARGKTRRPPTSADPLARG